MIRGGARAIAIEDARLDWVLGLLFDLTGLHCTASWESGLLTAWD
jgi:hypothetical protein